MQSELTVDSLAQEIRRVDGNHSLGAGALAGALIPFLTAALSDKQAVEVKIKPLEWRDADERNGYGRFIRSAETAFSNYRILKGSQGRFEVYYGFFPFSGSMTTLEEAESWGQADYEQRIRSALVDVPVAIPTANCCVCGRIIDTREKSEGGDDHGDETAPGKWTCSVSCYDAFTGYVPDVPAVEPVAWLVRDNDDEEFRVSFIEPDICWQKRPLYTSPPLSREGEDSAEVDRLRRALNAIAHTFTEDSHGGTKSLPASEYQQMARDALAATRSGSATDQKGCADE